MKTVFIKYKKDEKSFKLFDAIGANVIKLDNPEEIDEKLDSLYKNNFRRIIVTNEVANFSENIIRKYGSKENISIIILP